MLATRLSSFGECETAPLFLISNVPTPCDLFGLGSCRHCLDMHLPTLVSFNLRLQLCYSSSQVAAVVNSHLHFDHCGQNPALHGGTIPFWVQAAEYEALRQDPYYTDSNWALAPEPQRRTVRGDERIAEGVTIIATPGHTAGHQSVLVEAGDRRVVIGAQIVWHSDEFTAEVASAANVDPNVELRAAAVDSIKRIKALKPEIVHFSHCQALRPQRTNDAA